MTEEFSKDDGDGTCAATTRRSVEGLRSLRSPAPTICRRHVLGLSLPPGSISGLWHACPHLARGGSSVLSVVVSSGARACNNRLVKEEGLGRGGVTPGQGVGRRQRTCWTA